MSSTIPKRPFERDVPQCWWDGVSFPKKKNVTKVYGSTLLALRGGAWVSNVGGGGRYEHLNGP